ncbi:hypothetical protein Pcinc_026153, partial [Petrolisthes cinctipes]
PDLNGGSSVLSFHDLLPENPKDYDKMRPPKKQGRPTNVFFHVTVMGIDSINENSMVDKVTSTLPSAELPLPLDTPPAALPATTTPAANTSITTPPAPPAATLSTTTLPATTISPNITTPANTTTTVTPSTTTTTTTSTTSSTTTTTTSSSTTTTSPMITPVTKTTTTTSSATTSFNTAPDTPTTQHTTTAPVSISTTLPPAPASRPATNTSSSVTKPTMLPPATLPSVAILISSPTAPSPAAPPPPAQTPHTTPPTPALTPVTESLPLLTPAPVPTPVLALLHAPGPALPSPPAAAPTPACLSQSPATAALASTVTPPAGKNDTEPEEPTAGFTDTNTSTWWLLRSLLHSTSRNRASIVEPRDPTAKSRLIIHKMKITSTPEPLGSTNKTDVSAGMSQETTAESRVQKTMSTVTTFKSRESAPKSITKYTRKPRATTTPRLRLTIVESKEGEEGRPRVVSVGRQWEELPGVFTCKEGHCVLSSLFHSTTTPPTTTTH